MPVLAVTHNFAPNTLAQADQVDQNFSDIVSWANTNVIQKDASVAFTNIPSGPASDATTDQQFMRNAFVARGVHTAVGDGNATHAGTISFGKTFSVPPIPVAVVRVTAGISLVIRYVAAPTTTDVNYVVSTPNGGTFASTYHIYWIAFPVEP